MSNVQGSASKQKKVGATETSTASLIYVHNGKEQRMKDEDKMKASLNLKIFAPKFFNPQNFQVLRWNFASPRGEHVAQLKEQLQPCLSPELHAQMCHEDFKQHLKAIDTLTKVHLSHSLSPSSLPLTLSLPPSLPPSLSLPLTLSLPLSLPLPPSISPRLSQAPTLPSKKPPLAAQTSCFAGSHFASLTRTRRST